MKAFYFATEERKLRYDDNRPITIGESHRVDCEPVPCSQGLHASRRLIDALSYAPGCILYLVELGGQIIENVDKVCATERTYLAEFDARDLLIRFACDIALETLDRIRPYTDKYELIEGFLKNPTADTSHATTDAAIYAAVYAARAADTAIYAAHATADDSRAARAAREAAQAAADASRAVADVTYASDYAARVSTYATRAARENQNALLTAMVKIATGWDI
jgi:hypothetical protein